MYNVLIALIPAFLVSLYFFGVGALVVTLTSVAACVLFEYLIQKFLLKVEPAVSDGCGHTWRLELLLAFNVPSNLPIRIILIGALVAIGIGKMSFGGLGNNIFNPALVGRVFLLISFPVQMTTWPKPDALSTHYLDAETAATPLGLLKQGLPIVATTTDMLLGNIGGSLGEIGAIRPIDRSCLYAHQKSHYLAHSRIDFGDSISFLLAHQFRRELRPATIAFGRYAARCYFHGNRLRYFTYDP